MKIVFATLTALLITSPAFADKLNAIGTLTNTQAVTFTVGDKPGHQIYLTKMEGMVQSAGLLNNALYEITDLSDTEGQSGGYKTFTLPTVLRFSRSMKSRNQEINQKESSL